LFRLFLDRFDNVRMTMASRTNSHACVTVKEYISINVFNPDATSPFGNEFE
jgi:hypothetical protein